MNKWISGAELWCIRYDGIIGLGEKKKENATETGDELLVLVCQQPPATLAALW